MRDDMKFLVIGLGSMGKRRIRNLKTLGIKEIAGVDINNNRRNEVKEKYGINVYETHQSAMQVFNPDVFIVSTPPDLHMLYAYYAYENAINCFIEASVVDAEKIRELNEKIEKTSIIICPSCTMRYYPGPKKIKEIIRNNIIGKVLSFNYQTGQYLPDWHPWEKIENFYVSKRETGGAREIVPFELTWLVDIFGKMKPLSCIKTKLTDIPADIDDIYHCLLQFNDNILGNITIEVISRPKPTREMRILGSEGEIVFSADNNSIRYINSNMKDWIFFDLAKGTIENQYINPEEPYIEEIKDFIKAVNLKDRTVFPNSLKDDYDILQTLNKLENMAGEQL